MEPTTPEQPWSKTSFHEHKCELVDRFTWFDILSTKFTLHPAVQTMLEYQPVNYQQLALEWPHVSETDPMRLAYTRTVEHGEAGRQTITSIGKYLSRHWATIPDHTRRDALALYTPDYMSFVHTTPEIVMAAMFGPTSCMQKRGTPTWNQAYNWNVENSLPEPDWFEHPYSCYHPDHGWHVAVRYAQGRLDGRAVCLTYENKKVFVRTFKRNMDSPEDGYSYTDHSLQAWLESQGYELVDGWPNGAKLRTHYTRNGWLAPYLDGSMTRADLDDDETLVLDDYGEYNCADTSGYAAVTEDDEDDEDLTSCEDCDNRVHVDNTYGVGWESSAYVCEHCYNNNYTLVEAYRRGHEEEYSLSYDDAAHIEGTDRYIDPDHPPQDVVKLDSGYWYELDSTVCIDDTYYALADPEVVEVEEEGDEGHCYALRANCWQDRHRHWHRDDIDRIMVNGDWYTLDDANLPLDLEPDPEPQGETTELLAA